MTRASGNGVRLRMAGGAVKLIKENLIVAAVLVALAITFFVLRTTPTPLASMQDFDALTQGGTAGSRGILFQSLKRLPSG